MRIRIRDGKNSDPRPGVKSRIRNAENFEFRDSKEILSQICQIVKTNFVQLKHSRGKSRICPENIIRIQTPYKIPDLLQSAIPVSMVKHRSRIRNSGMYIVGYMYLSVLMVGSGSIIIWSDPHRTTLHLPALPPPPHIYCMCLLYWCSCTWEGLEHGQILQGHLTGSVLANRHSWKTAN